MPSFGRKKPPSERAGFTLVELLVVVAILGVLVLMALPTFNYYVTITKRERCIADIRSIDKAIAAYMIEKIAPPPDLPTIGVANQSDPWGRAYEYINHSAPGATPLEELGGAQINTDYDLYSFGDNGVSSAIFDAAKNSDDVARKNNGSIVELR